LHDGGDSAFASRPRLGAVSAQPPGLWSLVLFVVLVVISLGAELVSNDKPLVVRYEGQTYCRCAHYPEKVFGGDFETATDYLDPFIQAQLSKGGNWALFPPNPYGANTINYFAKSPNPRRPPRPTGWAPTTGARPAGAADLRLSRQRAVRRWR
jgi:ABC-type microcin C transport system permease subunit YejE